MLTISSTLRTLGLLVATCLSLGAYGAMAESSASATSATSGASGASSSAASASLTPEQEKAEFAAYEKQLMASLHPQHGEIKIPEARAILNLGQRYYFLDKADAKKVIVDAWGNPPEVADGVLGMVLPEGQSPASGWGAVVTYQDTGYVTDKDADKANYDDYIKEIQDGEADENAARKKAGYGTSHLIGWAEPPSYNRAAHYLIWARDIDFEGSPAHSLNYDIRLLGRAGVLSLNMVATMPELKQVHADALELAKAGLFDAGSRYEDYKQGDKTAEFGIAGLVAAGLGLAAAKKLGLLAVILAFGKKFIVIILAAFAGIGKWVMGLFGKKKLNDVPTQTVSFDEPAETPEPTATPEPPADPDSKP